MADKQIEPAEIHSVLENHFNIEELKTLCFYMDISFDDLPGDGRSAKARELIAYSQRHNRLSELVEKIKEQRSGIGNNHFSQRIATFDTPAWGWSNISWLIVITLIFIFLLLGIGNSFGLFISIQNKQVSHMIVEIGSILLSLIGIFLGITLVAVGSGQWHFAPRQRFAPMAVYRPPKLLNLVEIFIGLLLILTSIITIIVAFSSWRPFSLDTIHLSLILFVIFSIILFIGFIKPIPFTVLRNISRSGILPRVLGILLFVMTTAIWLSQGNTETTGANPEVTVPAIDVGEPSQDISIPTVISDNSNRVARFNQEQIKDGDTVNKSITPISGVHQNIPADHELWIVAQSGENCYPMNGPVKLEMSTGIWRHTEIKFPRTGETYLLSLVLANATVSDALRDAIGNQQGFLCSLIETEELETISVTVIDE